MPVLGNARYEAAAQVLAGRGSAEEAAAAAGYDTNARSFKSNARRFIQRDDIRARVQELQGNIADKVVTATAEWIEQQLVTIAEADVKEIKASDKIAALRELAKIRGIYAPEKVAPTTPDGDAPYDPLKISDEDRLEAIKALLAKVKTKDSS